LEGVKKVEDIKTSLGKDIERMFSRIEQLADQRKAQLDREKANAAKAELDTAKAAKTAAGAAISTAETFRKMAIEELSKAAAADKAGI
jgi:cell division FtsZ-interacting protein ZapD